MLYNSASEWTDAAQKRVLIFAMSGLGKTHVSNMLRDTGDWFHYSVDYRIGTRYMGEFIADNAKAEAMKVPFLRELLMSDSIYIGSNISFDDLSTVSTYLGKPGDPAKGGLPMSEYRRRQDQFQRAEISALQDTGYFMERSKALYGYKNFVCDTGGSICEWVDAENPDDPLLKELSSQSLMVWIEGSEDHTADLIERFDKAPKPMAYDPTFLMETWAEFLKVHDQNSNAVDPDTFIRWTYARALAHRQPRYAAMAKNWGVTVQASDMATVRDEADFTKVIAQGLAHALEMRS
ncbi:ATPase [Octadecabacter sp. 1_MG-2023]|uniref:ATPase n=1 Tax=unclassified Octadecabacter TaxID=196158 RepID=UPI001C0A0B04|nr:MULTISPECIES: ATPase [unclassified Octadecabacter]MBU2993333.1 ATPase [Octadecabacter sp. B2R22]MDO6733211.1 ATPase [Octadecabacter sp. 1_MG-2023]